MSKWTSNNAHAWSLLPIFYRELEGRVFRTALRSGRRTFQSATDRNDLLVCFTLKCRTGGEGCYIVWRSSIRRHHKAWLQNLLTKYVLHFCIIQCLCDYFVNVLSIYLVTNYAVIKKVNVGLSNQCRAGQETRHDQVFNYSTAHHSEANYK